ncbi:MAG: hypothetical protein JWM78_2692 [Verrucomicrobiaceae bacterium]|nr:hypothetical protein [Verrucomicrobiaceae bacterium]
MANLQITEVKPFIPAKDFAISKHFYESLGWVIKWSDANLALMENANQRFYLQNYYAKEWAENTMLHITVADAFSSYTRIKALLESGEFAPARVAEPKQESYGALVTYLWDPAGVLLHLAQWIHA